MAAKDERTQNSSEADALLADVYGELRRLAQHYLASERPGHTLSATALVHEAYLKLVRQDATRWQNRGHFLAVASIAMRRILVNYARDRNRDRRGGKAQRLALDSHSATASLVADDRLQDVMTVDALLDGLESRDPRAARVVQCRFFAGLTNEETAEALGVSPMTVKRAWRLGRAWMNSQIASGHPEHGAGSQ